MSEKTWWPSLEEYNPEISKEKWLEILADRNLTTEQNLHILACLYDFGGEATCTQLAQKYGETKNTYNSGFSNYAKRLVNTKICSEPPFRSDESSRWWPVLFVGHDAEKDIPGSYVWKLREELKDACKEYNILRFLGKKDNFTWIPIYKELANKLLEYRNNRKELVKIVYAMDREYTGFLHDSDGNDFVDLHPFAIFSIFNRLGVNSKRQKILLYFKEQFSLQSEIPEDFDGIPSINPQNSFWGLYWDHESTVEIEQNWDLFSIALENDFNEEKFNYCFNLVKQQNGAKWNVTQALFRIFPERFFSIDSNSKLYIEKYNIQLFKDNELTGEKYLSFTKLINEKIRTKQIKETSFVEISHAAWIYAKNYKTIWLVGTSFDDKDHTTEFINENKWEARFDNEKDSAQIKLLKNISEDDIIVLKSTFTKGADHSIPSLRIKAIGIVQNIDVDIKDGKTYVYANVIYFNPDEKDFDGAVYGKYRKTIHECDNKEIIDYVNSLKGGKKMENLSELLLNTHNLILHGAPGTGKTHLAKEIAKELNAEVGFVQFHPSYDYTDFVEGLRPIYNSERDVVFERKNGVFKGFCLSALETIKNKNKSESNLIEEDKIKKALKQFIDTAIEEQCYFFTKTNAEFTITAINEKYIFVQNVANEKYSEIKIKLDDILSVLLADEITEISEIKKIVGRDVSRQEDSYNFCIAKLVNLFINEGTIKLGVLSEKELNSALDLFRQECEKSDSGIVIKSSRSNAEFTTKMDDGVLVATSSKINGFQRINITGVKRYLNSLQFNQHQTYEPSVGEYILNNKEKYFSNNEPFVEIRIDVGESNSVNIHEEKENYVFIIDEINRGELSKIFGELFFNIDPGYRGLDGKINTQYQNLIEEDDPFYEGFYIPDNVYIIGTMNDIDRSVESMDFAFRRRFTFKEITAEDTQESILAELDETIRAEAIKRMNSLNNKIWHKPTENESYEDQSIEGLSSAYHIGGAYFLKLKELNYDFDKLWEYHLSGLLREYLRGMEDAEELLKKLHKAYNLESQE